MALRERDTRLAPQVGRQPVAGVGTTLQDDIAMLLGLLGGGGGDLSQFDLPPEVSGGGGTSLPPAPITSQPLPGIGLESPLASLPPSKPDVPTQGRGFNGALTNADGNRLAETGGMLPGTLSPGPNTARPLQDTVAGAPNLDFNILELISQLLGARSPTVAGPPLP